MTKCFGLRHVGLLIGSKNKRDGDILLNESSKCYNLLKNLLLPGVLIVSSQHLGMLNHAVDTTIEIKLM